MFDQTKSEFGKGTIMKQQKLFGIVMTVCALLLILAGCAPSFEGNRIKNADSYRLDIKTMNCTDTHTLELKHGDTLKIIFETVQGSLEMKITAPDGTALYQGDGTVTEFSVTAPLDGPYAIVIVGQQAKGNIYIDVERVTRGEGETGNGGKDEVEASYPGADAVELLNHHGDTITVYKSAGGTNIPFYL